MVRILSVAVALALFSAAMWFAWLGWDHEYYMVDGYPQGPYRAWQVIGCGASITLATLAAYLVVRRTAAVFVLPAAAVLGFAVPWGRDASLTDESGLWVVGLVMIVVGGAGALTALLGVSAGINAAVTATVRKSPRASQARG
jgi:hypothetical protein